MSGANAKGLDKSPKVCPARNKISCFIKIYDRFSWFFGLDMLPASVYARAMLKRTQDRKTANLASPNGRQSKIANAFSLPAGRDYSCPGATDFCNSICYAGKLERIYKGFREVVLHNWNTLKDMSILNMAIELSDMIDAFRADCDKWDAPKAFRIHADGDFFNMEYVQAWANVIQTNPDIQFWAYTRVDYAATWLNDCAFPNLGLYFSANPDNLATAKAMESLGIRIAMVDKSFALARDAFKGARCPEQNGALNIISDKGGACLSCGLCVNGRANVLFSTSKK